MGFISENVRNVAFVGHGGTGKTTLTEHLLFAGGAIGKPESVDSGKTVSDFLEEEIHQRMSIHTSLSNIVWKDRKINLLDAPGAGDFVGEVISAFRVAETAAVVVGAKAGVQIETIKLWRRMDLKGQPRLVFINRMDEERADYAAILKDLKARFKRTFVPVTIPMGEAATFSGVIDVLESKAYSVPAAGEQEKSSDVPASSKAVFDEYRQTLIEGAADGDDELMTVFLEKGSLTQAEVVKGLAAGLRSGKLVPVLCGAASKQSGLAALLDFFTTVCPSPGGFPQPVLADDQESTAPISSKGEFSAFCYKTTIDQFSGQLSFVKIISGKLAHDSEAVNQREGKKERISKIYTCLGKKLIDATEAEAGDLCILAKLAHTRTNDSLCSADISVKYAPLALSQPVHAVAVAAASKKDEDKLNPQLLRAAEEDPTFHVRFNPETKQTVISGMGELQINMILEKIKKTQKIEIQTSIPKVAYRETIAKSADSTYRHKKQSGGHGQFAEVSISVKPVPRGQHYSFENGIRGMAVSKGYIPGIEKGLHEGMEAGVLAGYPVMDVGITLTDGKEHPVDSSEMAFKIAAREALKAGMEKASPVLLEPIMNLSVFIEDQYLGDVLSDMSSRRGKVLGQEQLGGGISEVKAQVPQSELLRYAIDLKALTSGTGAFEVSFDHYSPVSGKAAEEVIKAAKEAKAAEAASH